MRNLPQIMVAPLLLAVVSLSPALAGQGPSAWLVIAPVDEGFSIEMPVKPEVQTEQAPMMGNSYKVRLYTGTDERSGLLYMAIMQEFPVLSPGFGEAARLEKYMEGFSEGLGNEFSKSAAVKPEMQPDGNLDLKGHIGRQYKLTVGDWHGVVRAFDGGRRVYVLLVLGADEKNSDVGRFFNSFEIKPAPAPVPITETKPS